MKPSSRTIPPSPPTPPAPPESAPPWGGAARWAIPLAIFVLAFAAFLPSLENGLVDLDDEPLLVENTRYRGLSIDSLRWMFSATLLGHYQPLTWVSYAIDYEIAGFDPAMFHFTSMALHAANAVLFYFLCLRLLTIAGFASGERERLWRGLAAVAAALFWALHPLRVESVSWATERRDVLSGLFWLSALLAYLRAFPPRSVKPASTRWYALSVLLLLLSLLSKAWGMTFFVVLIVLDWYPLRRLPPNPFKWLSRDALIVLAQKIPYAILGVACALTARWAIGTARAMRSLDEWPLYARLAQAFYGLVWYVRKTLIPADLCALYELPMSVDPWAPRYLAAYAAVAAAAVAILLLWNRAGWFVAAAGIYAILVGPVLGLFQSGDQFVADRYSYLSTMSWALLVGAGFGILARRLNNLRLVGLVAAVLFGALAFLTWEQAKTWKDPLTLWRHAASCGPERGIARMNVGIHLDKAGKLDEAIEWYTDATSRRPRDGRAWFTLANALRTKGDFEGAERAFRESAAYLPQAFMPLVNLGYLLERQNRMDEALECFKAAARSVEPPLRPGAWPSGKPYLALGLALKQRGDTEGARAAFSRALEMALEQKDSETEGHARGQLRELDAQR